MDQPTVDSDGFLVGEPDWDELVRARRTYLLQQMFLLSPNNDPVPLLRAALASDTSDVAIEELDMMAEHRTDLVRSLVPDLFPHTLGLHPICGKARHTLHVLDPTELQPLLTPMVDAFLADPTMGWQEFRSLGMLLDQPGLDGLLARVTATAAQSDDLDIREVAEDFAAPGHQRSGHHEASQQRPTLGQVARPAAK
jgi:hypothetical protein